LLQQTVRLLFAEAVRRMVFGLRGACHSALRQTLALGQRRQHRKRGKDRNAADRVAVARENMTFGNRLVACSHGCEMDQSDRLVRAAAAGPATPVTDTAMSACEWARAPAAIARATGSLTAP